MSIPVINVSPNLPLPPQQYDQHYFDALTKVLRLYFTSNDNVNQVISNCLLYTSPSPRDGLLSRMPSSA